MKRIVRTVMIAAAMVLLLAPVAVYAAEDAKTTEQAEEQGSEAVVSVKLNETSLSMGVVGQTEQLTVTVTPTEAASDLTVAWKSSDSSVVKVSGDGTLNAKGQATATVTEVYSGKSGKKADITVTISAPDGGSESLETSCKVTVSLYNGVYPNPNGTSRYYYQNGKVSSITDVKKINGTWYNLKKGKVVGNTVAKNKNGWWYIDKNGEVDFSYNGFGKNGNGSWYCEKGKVTFKKQGILKDTTGALGEKGAWYYVMGSKVQTDFTGLSNFSNEHGWWYIKNGKVDFTHNGVDKNQNGWWYVVGGKVQFGYTGVANYKNKNGWWYVKNGKVDFTYTGLAKNQNGWWYIKDGKVDFSYTGYAKNKNGTWFVKNGKVQNSVKSVTVFTGASIMSGLNPDSYNGISKINISGSKHVVARKSLSAKTLRTSKVFDGATGVQKICSYQPTRVYIMMGNNEVTWKSDADIYKDYSNLVQEIRKSCPYTEIVILAISPVTKAKATSSPGFKKANNFNEQLKKVAKDNHCYFYDYTDAFKDSSGYLRTDYCAGDGLHWNAKAYAKFGELISAYDKNEY